MSDKPYHEIKERCIGHGFEWSLYVQKRAGSGRLVLEPNHVNDPSTTAFAFQIDGDIAEVLLTYGVNNDE